jgi:hypothetical protein
MNTKILSIKSLELTRASKLISQFSIFPCTKKAQKKKKEQAAEKRVVTKTRK